MRRPRPIPPEVHPQGSQGRSRSGRHGAKVPVTPYERWIRNEWDFELGLLADRISPTLLATGARLATRMSFAEAREVLGWFVPQSPSTEVLEQAVLGFGHHTEA